MSEPLVLGFGKYRDRDIEEVYKMDRDYLFWLSKQKTLNVSQEITDWLTSKFIHDDKSTVLNFGKYKGRTIRWVHGMDLKYFMWLSRNEFVQNGCSDLKADIDQILEKSND
jgi:uncharacterized protein (DUF3820 family)